MTSPYFQKCCEGEENGLGKREIIYTSYSVLITKQSQSDFKQHFDFELRSLTRAILNIILDLSSSHLSAGVHTEDRMPHFLVYPLSNLFCSPVKKKIMLTR